jgi:signal transduction histidine kinase
VTEDTLSQIRGTIFALRDPQGTGPSVRRSVSLLISQLSPVLGFGPEVHLAGPLDTLADELMLSDVEAVLRESLTNIGRHAQATAADVKVEVNSQRLMVTVSDNGVGLGQPVCWSGLTNLRSRAEHRGGSLVLDRSPEGGLHLQWTIPITL